MVAGCDYLDRWLATGRITSEQHQRIGAMISRRRISLFVELNALLYLGVVAFAVGFGWTARTYSAQWGDAAILLPATALLLGCLAYCFRRVPPFSTELVDAPSLVFDYVLYLGCLLFAVELGYIEYRFHLMREQWDAYLLASAVLYFALAYRFDNRLVLSLGIATLGGWFGVRVTRADLLVVNPARLSALVYGASVAVLGVGLHGARIKRHFLETYLHLAANVVLAALVSGVFDSAGPSLWLAGLLVGASATIAGGIRFQRFAFVAYGTLYGYVGVSRELLRNIHGDSAVLSYLVLSAAIVIGALVVLSRRMGRAE